MKELTRALHFRYGGEAGKMATELRSRERRDRRDPAEAFKAVTREAIRIQHANRNGNRRAAKLAALATAAECIRFAAEVEGRKP